MQNATAIGPLTKVTLILAASADDSSEAPPQENIQFEFVYGIGTAGLSAFEMELQGLSAGARIKVRTQTNLVQSYFEHLRCPLLEAVKIQPPFDLSIEVLSVRPATHRELVHALANIDGSECNCDCGCGC